MATDNHEYDAVIVGSGPNGLSAGIRLSQKGLKVLILEAKDTIGGGTRTLELTEPGFKHDICSAVHPTAAGSPFFKTLNLEEYGLEWIHPPYPFAHPLGEDKSVFISRSMEQTLEGLGPDAKAYEKLYSPFVQAWDKLSNDLFGTLRIPSHPFHLARFGLYGMLSAKGLSSSVFDFERTRAMFAGCAAHSIIPLDKMFTSSFGLVLGASAHAVGWPVAKGGSSAVSSALAALFKELGGTIQTSTEVRQPSDIPSSKTVLFDLTPQQIVSILSNKLPSGYRKKLKRYQYGPGTFKMDFALSEPVPWSDSRLQKAGTLHLGGSIQEIARSEQEVWDGIHPQNPYVLISQPSLFDDSRAPEGKHTLWAYCHVPSGSEEDMSRIIEDQIEKHAPGFRDTIIAKHTLNSQQFESYNSNYIGGDINGGAQIFKQLFGRPVLKWDPYKMPLKGHYICSSSTPPGGGVHGMCGFNAAESVLKNEFDL